MPIQLGILATMILLSYLHTLLSVSEEIAFELKKPTLTLQSGFPSQQKKRVSLSGTHRPLLSIDKIHGAAFPAPTALC